MTTGVRVHGLALARPTAKAANMAAVPMAISVRATPLACWYDCPSAVEIAAKAAATHMPTASAACAAAARRSARGGGDAGEMPGSRALLVPAAPVGRVAMSSHQSVIR